MLVSQKFLRTVRARLDERGCFKRLRCTQNLVTGVYNSCTRVVALPNNTGVFIFRNSRRSASDDAVIRAFQAIMLVG
jgi:hypothetical protein